MLALQDLIDFAKEQKIDPKKCKILLHQVCGNDDIELDYFDKIFKQENVRVLNADDEFENVESAISLEQLWISSER
jgi:hypothetical protein